MKIDKEGNFKAKDQDGKFKFVGSIKDGKFTAKNEIENHFYNGDALKNESGEIYKIVGNWGRTEDSIEQVF